MISFVMRFSRISIGEDCNPWFFNYERFKPFSFSDCFNYFCNDVRSIQYIEALNKKFFLHIDSIFAISLDSISLKSTYNLIETFIATGKQFHLLFLNLVRCHSKSVVRMPPTR